MNYFKTVSIAFFCLLSTSVFANDVYTKVPQIASESAVNSLDGGLQFIYNKSNKTVIIELGDFFPTPYKLAPGESTIALVSSNRQAITIRSAE
ncbi:hypothetical protein [Legionella bononiensis]|uniref:Uncharacterized protein n=1 Tax=Legionella bononiensis TaxID=2793102 RepID=A0ABS1WAI3_9GAMM|nr:hypothetical protein [Legionella bononiensis]MBL7480420.1 hypothetical protein [Legionella bononiensis]MBL7526348.1 hypothetical protein [Legionella bononiensis]MBL7563160.1 hypothetical protein [Legionella bononiensis]